MSSAGRGEEIITRLLTDVVPEIREYGATIEAAA
jgi:hypothetical protein